MKHGSRRCEDGLSHRITDSHHIRDKDLYTTTYKCLQCRIKIMYTVFQIICVYV